MERLEMNGQQVSTIATLARKGSGQTVALETHVSHVRRATSALENLWKNVLSTIFVILKGVKLMDVVWMLTGMSMHRHHFPQKLAPLRVAQLSLQTFT
jgi:hypothetical protein